MKDKQIRVLLSNEYTCIIEFRKYETYNNILATWIQIHIAKRSAKKRYFKNKVNNMYHYGGGTLQDITKIAIVVKDYLNKEQPKYIVISAYPDLKYKQRECIYSQFMKKNEYVFMFYDKDENGCKTSAMVYKKL